jgi:hypothetical protein
VAIGGFFSESPLRPPDSFMSYRNEGMSEAPTASIEDVARSHDATGELSPTGC